MAGLGRCRGGLGAAGGGAAKGEGAPCCCGVERRYCCCHGLIRKGGGGWVWIWVKRGVLQEMGCSAWVLRLLLAAVRPAREEERLCWWRSGHGEDGAVVLTAGRRGDRSRFWFRFRIR